MVKLLAIEAIVAALDVQYVEELEEDYAGYKNQTIKKLVTQLRMWYVITTKEKLAIKSHSLALCSDTPESNVTTFTRQLDRRQVECEYHGVTITDVDKVDNFMDHMYACGLFKSKFLDDLEETADKLWGETHPHFIRKFNKERRKQ